MPGFHSRARVAALTAVALTTCAFIGSAVAASFGISSTRVHLGATRPNETIVLSNQEARPLAFEIHVFRWTQKTDGQWEQVPSTDLVVHPLIVRVAEKGEARVRIGTLSTAVAKEQAYRIEIQELPDSPTAPAGQVRMLTKMSVPVFVEPTPAKPNLALSVDGIGAHGASLSLRNDGTAYAEPVQRTLRVLDASGKALHESPLDTGYVLAGARLPVQAKLPASVCARAARIELAVADQPTIVATIPSGSRRCTP